MTGRAPTGPYLLLNMFDAIVTAIVCVNYFIEYFLAIFN
jgi:hypothetical protein